MTILNEDSLAYMMSGGKRDPFATRRAFAQKLAMQGTDTSPVQSPWQGVGRLAQALAGAYGTYRADADEKQAKDDLATKIADAGKLTDPVERLNAFSAINPEIGLRYSAQSAADEIKQAGSRAGLQAGAGTFGSIYSPQGGGSTLPPMGGYQGPLGGYESGNNPQAVNPVSGAAGEFQFMPATWQDVRKSNPDLNLPEDVRQAPREVQAKAEERFRAGNAKALQAAGIPPTPANLYLAHRAGAQGAQTILAASPDAPLSTVVPPEWIAQNPDMRTTVGQFLQMAQQRFPGGQQPGGLPITITPRPQVPQGSMDGQLPGQLPGQPPAPQPGMVAGPTLAAPPQVPEVPRPQPSRQQIAQYQQRIASGEFGKTIEEAQPRARAALEAELDRDWAVQRDRAKMQFGQQTADFTDQRRIQREQEKDDRTRGQPSRQEIEKLHTARTEAATIVSALTDFEREFKNTGTWGALKSVAGATTPVNTAYNTAALLAKGEQLFNLGVLNGPDLDIIRRTLPDPSTPRGALASSADMSAAVGKVVDLLQTRLTARERQLGLPVTDVRGAANEIRATMPGAQAPTPQGRFVGPDGRAISMQDIEETARNRGMDPQAVIQRLQLRPVQ